jgi:hypothetical protein
MIEHALVFDVEGRVIRFHRPPGCSAGGIPDTRDLWDTLWKWRGHIGGVAHTHPWPGSANPSQTDVTTWRACEQGLGKLLLWPIVTCSEVGYFVFNKVTGLYCRANPNIEISGLDRLLEMSLEDDQSQPHSG